MNNLRNPCRFGDIKNIQRQTDRPGHVLAKMDIGGGWLSGACDMEDNRRSGDRLVRQQGFMADRDAPDCLRPEGIWIDGDDLGP